MCPITFSFLSLLFLSLSFSLPGIFLNVWMAFFVDCLSARDSRVFFYTITIFFSLFPIGYIFFPFRRDRFSICAFGKRDRERGRERERRKRERRKEKKRKTEIFVMFPFMLLLFLHRPEKKKPHEWIVGNSKMPNLSELFARFIVTTFLARAVRFYGYDFSL